MILQEILFSYVVTEVNYVTAIVNKLYSKSFKFISELII